MTPVTHARNVAFGILVALCFAGCGSDDGTTTPTASPDIAETREQFIAEGDALCARVNTKVETYNDRIQAVASGSNDASARLEAIAPIFREAYEVQRQALKDWRALKPATADDDVIEQLDSAYSEQTALVGRVADAATAGDAQRVSSLGSEIELVRNRAKRLAQSYGFRVCGSRDQ